MTDTDTNVDLKAGWCMTCRAGHHSLCAAPRCACPRPHHRPTLKETPMPRPATVTPIAKTKAPKPAAEYELVKADLPVKPRVVRVTLADRVGPLLDEIGDGDWYRIVRYSTSRLKESK